MLIKYHVIKAECAHTELTRKSHAVQITPTSNIPHSAILIKLSLSGVLSTFYAIFK